MAAVSGCEHGTRVDLARGRMTAPTKSAADLRELLETLEGGGSRKTYGGKFLFFTPYPKQRAHLLLGRTKRERLLMAGNRLGKSETGAVEAGAGLPRAD